MKTLFLILSLLTFIVSCSHTPKQPTHTEYFVTHILADDTKMFSYNMTFEKPRGSRKQGQRGGGEPKVGGGGRMGKGGDRNKQGNSNRSGSKQRLKKQFYTNLENILLENNYCRDGYIELNSFIDREDAEMKGQCHEKANVADRMKFKNQ